MGGMLCTRRRNLPLDQSSPFSPSKTQRRFYAPEHQELPRELESGAMGEPDEFRRKKAKGVTRVNGLAGDSEERAWDVEQVTPTSQATPKSILADHCEDRFGSRRSRPDSNASRFREEHPLASPPRKLRWKKGELIGAGAFGRVYMGMNVESGELIAVKQVLVAKNNPDKQKAQEQIRELEEEVALLKNLSHENIVRYIGTDREEEALNIFLEFVPGGSIASLLGKFGAFSERVVRVYTRQLLLGLKYLHDHHIMHRDIKGANILVDNKGCIKLADFGASKKLQDLATVAEGYKTMKGTPYWMAPEVIKGTGHGRPADIWSVGCTVIEMATGKAPWSQFQNPVAAIYHIASAQTGPPIPDSLSPEGQDFLRKCLQRDQKLRPAVGVLLQHPFLSNPMPQSVRGTVGNSFVQSVSRHQVSVQRGSELKSTWESNNLTDPLDDSCLPRGYLSTAMTDNFGTMPEFGAQGWDENGLMSNGAAFCGAPHSTLQASNQYNGKPPLRSTSGAFLDPGRFELQSKASPSGEYLEERRAGEQVGTSGRGVLNTMNGNSQRQWALRSPVGEVGDGPWSSDAGLSLRSYNPMQEPSYMGPGGISWFQAARGSVVAEPSSTVMDNHNAQHGATVHHHMRTVDEGEYHGSSDKTFSGTPAGHDAVSGLDAEEEEVTEVSIIRYLNTKALELSRLQTPLLEEFQLQGDCGSPFSLSSSRPPNPQEHYPDAAHHKWQVPELSDSQRHDAASSPRTTVLGAAGTVLGGSQESEASIGTGKKRTGHLLSTAPTPSFPGAADASGYQDALADNTRASTREQQWQRELQLELARQRGRTNM